MEKVYLIRSSDAYAGARSLLAKLNFSLRKKRVLIKPNLTVNASPKSGITPDVGLGRAVLERLEDCDVVIGDAGTGDTEGALTELGWAELAREFGARTMDLNRDEIVWLDIPHPFHARRIPFAKTAVSCDYLINIAKLKIHSLATVTLCLKNLFGCVPTRRHRLVLHPFIGKVVADIAQVIRSDLNLVDGIVGNELDEVVSHPVHSGILLAGRNPLAVDSVGARCMGVEPNEVEYLRLLTELRGLKRIEVIGERIEDVARAYRRERPLTTSLRYAYERALSFIYRKFG
ncbi:MAG: DUF362 domain-containing protein [Candidatus Micrarchaeia archaeon]